MSDFGYLILGFVIGILIYKIQGGNKMSNNKQSMKLYTEEQIFKYLLENGTIDLDSFILDMNPIELPSDEEIEEMGKDVIIYNDTKRGWFVEGLKFMRDKIQGGKK